MTTKVWQDFQPGHCTCSVVQGEERGQVSRAPVARPAPGFNKSYFVIQANRAASGLVSENGAMAVVTQCSAGGGLTGDPAVALPGGRPSSAVLQCSRGA